MYVCIYVCIFMYLCVYVCMSILVKVVRENLRMHYKFKTLIVDSNFISHIIVVRACY